MGQQMINVSKTKNQNKSHVKYIRHQLLIIQSLHTSFKKILFAATIITFLVHVTKASQETTMIVQGEPLEVMLGWAATCAIFSFSLWLVRIQIINVNLRCAHVKIFKYL